MRLNRERSTLTVFTLAVIALIAYGAAGKLSMVAGQAVPTPAGQNAPATLNYYNQKVVPIFQANCYRCHGGMNHRGGLNMDTMAGMLKGGRDGAVLVPGHADQSLLIKLIRHEGPADDPMPMPPRGDKISDADIATVTAWINAGAKMPEDR